MNSLIKLIETVSTPWHLAAFAIVALIYVCVRRRGGTLLTPRSRANFTVTLAALLLLLGRPAAAKQGEAEGTQNANACLSVIGSIPSSDSKAGTLGQIRKTISQYLANKNQPADVYFLVAEMMKRVGDYRARDYYDKAIQADPNEPCYDVFYADYLRNFRGAGTPLFPQAEEHYFAASRKLRIRQNKSYQNADQQTQQYLDRGLSALYQRDGIALLSWRSIAGSPEQNLERPFAFFSSVNRYAQATADLDREADIRDYTSEALFSESAIRLARPLTAGELRALIRTKEAAETQDRLRFRYKNMPAIDIYYTHRQTDSDQVTNFFVPDTFNALRLNEYGATVQKPFTIGDGLDASLSGTFEVDQRWGLIEFAPGSEERIFNYQAQAAVSHFFGPDKASVNFTFAHQSIHPEINPTEPDRHRQFVGSNATYSIFRRIPFLQNVYNERFETRGWDVFGGFLRDTESFPPALVTRNDYFVGTALKGVWRFDFTLQPTWFTSSVSNDASQRNAQYRTSFTTLFRIVDEERGDGIPMTKAGLHLAFLHLVVPFRQDSAFRGPTSFENSKVGVELDSKFFTYSRWSTFLLSARYDHQDFNQLGKNKNMFSFNLSLGF